MPGAMRYPNRHGKLSSEGSNSTLWVSAPGAASSGDEVAGPAAVPSGCAGTGTGRGRTCLSALGCTTGLGCGSGRACPEADSALPRDFLRLLRRVVRLQRQEVLGRNLTPIRWAPGAGSPRYWRRGRAGCWSLAGVASCWERLMDPVLLAGPPNARVGSLRRLCSPCSRERGGRVTSYRAYELVLYTMVY